jgi:hypothetical protein
MWGQVLPPDMNPPDETIQCRLAGGPFDGTDCDDFSELQIIMMRAGPGEHYAIYRRPKPDVIAGDGRIIFHFDTIAERPIEMNPASYSVRLDDGRSANVRFSKRAEGSDGQELWEIVVSDESGNVLDTSKRPLAFQGADRDKHLRREADVMIAKLNISGAS